MAEGAIALADRARSEPEFWPEAINASDKVAAYIYPKLKAIEHTGADGGPFVVMQATGDAEL